MDIKDQIFVLQEKENELKQAVPLDVVALGKVQAQLADLQSQHGELEQRVQAQEEKVQSITLPYDFNEVFSDESYINKDGKPYRTEIANDVIVELVQQYQRQSNDEHNTEIVQVKSEAKTELEQVKADFKQQLSAADDRETQLKRQNDVLQEKVNTTEAALQKSNDDNYAKSGEIADLQQKLKNATDQLDEKDAEIKRLNDKVDEQRAEIALGGVVPALKVVDVGSNDKLDQLIQESKSAKMKTALELALERTTGTAATLVLPTIQLPTTEQVLPSTDNGELAQTSVEPSSDHQQEVKPFQEVHGGSDLAVQPPTKDGTSAEAVTREEHETLKAEVQTLKDEVAVLKMAKVAA